MIVTAIIETEIETGTGTETETQHLTICRQVQVAAALTVAATQPRTHYTHESATTTRLAHVATTGGETICVIEMAVETGTEIGKGTEIETETEIGTEIEIVTAIPQETTAVIAEEIPNAEHTDMYLVLRTAAAVAEQGGDILLLQIMDRISLE